MNKEKIIKDALILFLITLVSGLLLGLVYEVTKAPRKKQQEKAKMDAYKKVFKNADDFKDLDFDEKGLEKFLKDNKVAKASINSIATAKKDGSDVGYVITVTDSEGYGGDIVFSIGIDKEGVITGLSYLSISETAGVGMKVKEEKFYGQFVGKKVDSFVYTKDGKKSDEEIDAVGGATISTNAVVNGVNAGLLAYKYINK